MKAILVCCVGFFVVVASTVRAEGEGASAPRFTIATVEQTEKSLNQAIESNSLGLQVTAAQTVRSLKTLMPERSFSCFVIPLMRIVKDDNEERCARVVAAIALHELHSAVGDYAIAREAKFADCPEMRHLCAWLAYYRLLEDRPELAAK